MALAQILPATLSRFHSGGILVSAELCKARKENLRFCMRAIILFTFGSEAPALGGIDGGVIQIRLTSVLLGKQSFLTGGRKFFITIRPKTT